MGKVDRLDAVRACAAELGHPPASNEYERWRRRSSKFPSRQTVGRGLPSWQAVLAEAGLGRRHIGRYSKAQAWITVTRARRELGSPSDDQYDRWRGRVSPRPMSRQILLARSGRTWAELFHKN